MKNYVNLNTKLYAELFAEGGDNLVAVFCILKHSKNGAIKIYKENRSIFHTLKEKTSLSVTTLRKYLKTLQKMELCHFDGVGNFVLKGGNKINKQYKSTKTVRVQIGTYTETKVNSFFIRVHKMHKQQQKRIVRREEQKKIIGKLNKNIPLTTKEYNFYKSWRDADKAYAKNIDTFNANTSLSNYGFSKLKFGETKSKATGYYWKNKLKSAEKIKTRREFEFLKKCTLEEYKALRNSGYTNLLFRGGKLFRELVSSFEVVA